MKIATGVEMLEISATVMGRTDTIYPTLIWDNNAAILVDTGYPGQLAIISEKLDNAGVSLNKLNKIIITHHDIDHIGNLPDILRVSPQTIEVMSHDLEKPHIQGEKGILKVTPEAMSQLDTQLSAIPDEQRKAIKSVLENPPKAKINTTLADGEELPYCGGIIVIHMPGHTPGHLGLYHKQSKTLIAGDAMYIVDGQLLGPNPHLTFDMKSALKSLSKLNQYDIEKVICYHGGLFLNNPNQRIGELSNS